MSWPFHSEQPRDVAFLLGTLVERSDTIVDDLTEIKGRLRDGDATMSGMSARIAVLELHAKSKRGGDGVPNWERLLKWALPYLIGAVTLALTGSVPMALELFKALAGAK
jgi:hypothetical protein